MLAGFTGRAPGLVVSLGTLGRSTGFDWQRTGTYSGRRLAQKFVSSS